MNTRKDRMRSWFHAIGPGIITAALVFGPSKMTITSQLGADYGYALLWIVVVAIFFMIIYTTMAARIGLATQQSLLSTIKQRWGKWIAVTIGGCVFLVTASFQAGNAAGTGISLSELSGVSPRVAIVLFSLLAAGLLFFRSFYKLLEIFMTVMVIVMLLSFVATLFLATPDWRAAFMGFRPSVPKGAEVLVIAFIASCFSIVGAFYQSYLVQENRRVSHLANQATAKDKSIAGMLILGFMSMTVMVCAASILHPAGISIQTASDMGSALEPLFGEQAADIFLIGLFAASFSSLVGNATVGGTLLADALGYGHHFSSRAVRVCIALVMLAGAIVSILFGRVPLQLIVLAQGVTVFIVPIIGIAMFLIARDKRIMGDAANSQMANVGGALGLLLIIFLAAAGIRSLIF